MSEAIFNLITKRLHFGLRKKVPQILQVESTECGLASLAMICGYHGLDIDMLSLRQRFSVSTQGATLKTLLSTASAVGLKCRSLSLDLNEVKQLKLPCVLHWDMNHFVVLAARRRSSWVIHDRSGDRQTDNRHQRALGAFYRRGGGVLAGQPF